MEFKSILIATHETVVRKDLLNFLKNEITNNTISNYFVAIDGQKALEIIMAKIPNLILLELSLPVINGFEILRRVKRAPHENIRKIPVVVFSELTEKSEVLRVLQLGVEEYILKPLTMENIVTKIGKIISRDDVQKIIDKAFKPVLIELFGNAIANEMLAKAASAAAQEKLKYEKLNIIISSICDDGRFIRMLGTAGVRKLKLKWLELL